MYKNSYRGYKKNKYKFNNNFKSNKFREKKKNSARNPEITLAKLNIIRYTAIFIAIFIAFGVIIVGFVLYRNQNEPPLQSNSNVTEDSDRTQLLRVVNKNFPLKSDYVPDLTDFEGYSVNFLASDSLQMLLKRAEEEEISLSVDYAYVSFEEQSQKYQEEYNRLIKNQNLSEVTAEAKAQASVSKPGKSEYQTGLLIKFSTPENNDFSKTFASQWLEKNSIEYGFVIRYTEAKKSKTFMNADPSVYRFVGKEDARMMRSLEMCLDEYCEYLSSRE